VVLALTWIAVRHSFYAHDLVGDTVVYRQYAFAVRHGQVPYRDFGVEYPPGALAAIVLPAYLGSYVTAFAWTMFALAAITVVALYRDRPAAAYAVALAPLAVGALVENRFDFLPACLVTLAVLALARDRHRLGWAVLGAAVAAKLWPVCLVPLAAVWTYRRAGPRPLAASAAYATAVVALVFVPFVVLDAHDLWTSLDGQISRPLQVETLGAAFLKLTHHAGIAPSYTTQAVTGVAVRPVADLQEAAGLAILIALWIAFARGPFEPARLYRYAAAATATFVALGKVLSPQYTIWLVPLVPLVRGRRGFAATAVLAVAAVLGQVWYPQHYFDYVFHNRFAWVVLLRDLLLVALVALLGLPRVRRAHA
jgi:uncharacterized membrane protein